MKRVTRYHDDGASKSLPKLNHGRINHACGVFTKTGGSIVCFELICAENVIIYIHKIECDKAQHKYFLDKAPGVQI